METDQVMEAKEELEPRLSGAYIRSLVKQLTSKDPLEVSENSECYSSNTQKQQQAPTDTRPPEYKKQVRRRLQTTKPYQERLLNMAEARREIVAALKFHRASMKQQKAAQNAQSSLGQEKRSISRTVHSLYPSTTPANSYWPMSTFVLPPPPPPPLLSYDDNQNFVLPTQILGLNLNFQNFTNLDANIYQKPLSVGSPSSSSSTPSYLSSPAPSVPAGKPNSSCDLHQAMDDEEMAEIRSLGEQHQIEWNDTVNLVTSARWCSFLNTMKIEAEEGDEFHQFDQIMEFPPWLINANESSCLEQHFDDYFSDAYFQDPDLPCMDIGEIEAMDGEWLA
ncbi:hypothetical protein SSX86_006450 [Deinandra increscens subsp. villosa]|uniref:Hydroxyproline-rich glycoprotein family protein n=1 Tax=Deinandra increscens subsp. villosa TaxID=3103831 RepID=A0AAP0DEV2_9ASTR